MTRGLNTGELRVHGFNSCIECSFRTGFVVTEASGKVTRCLFGRLHDFLCLSDEFRHASGIGIVGAELFEDFLQRFDCSVRCLFVLQFHASLLDGFNQRLHVRFGNGSDGRCHLVELRLVDTEFRTVEELVAVGHRVVASVGQHFHAVVLVGLRCLEMSRSHCVVDLRILIELKRIRIGERADGQ